MWVAPNSHWYQVRKLTELEDENARLRREVNDLTLDKIIRVEASPISAVLLRVAPS